jgi:hypothetical protein
MRVSLEFDDFFPANLKRKNKAPLCYKIVNERIRFPY